jgi:hypothetical protein
MQILPGSSLRDEAKDRFDLTTRVRFRLASALMAVVYWVTPPEHEEVTQKHEARRIAERHGLTVEEDSEVYDDSE